MIWFTREGAQGVFKGIVLESVGWNPEAKLLVWVAQTKGSDLHPLIWEVSSRQVVSESGFNGVSTFWRRWENGKPVDDHEGSPGDAFYRERERVGKFEMAEV